MPNDKQTRLSILRGGIETFVLIAGLAGIIYGLDQYIQHKIHEITGSDDYLRRVAAHVRPFVIFDQDGSFLADSGAMTYINSISADLKLEGGLQRVVVSPNCLLTYPPLLEPIDNTQWSVTPTRGKGYDWIYLMSCSSFAGGTKDFRFRLEIIK